MFDANLIPFPFIRPGGLLEDGDACAFWQGGNNLAIDAVGFAQMQSTVGNDNPGGFLLLFHGEEVVADIAAFRLSIQFKGNTVPNFPGFAARDAYHGNFCAGIQGSDYRVVSAGMFPYIGRYAYECIAGGTFGTCRKYIGKYPGAVSGVGADPVIIFPAVLQPDVAERMVVRCNIFNLAERPVIGGRAENLVAGDVVLGRPGNVDAAACRGFAF